MKKLILGILGFLVVGIAALCIWYFKRQKDAVIAKKIYSVDDFEAGIPALVNYAGVDIAKQVEQIFRTETGNFTSSQFTECGSPGMQAVKNPDGSFHAAPYYGWGPNSFWLTHLEYTPLGLDSMFENAGLSNDGGIQQDTTSKQGFIVMPSVEAAMVFCAWVVKQRGRPGGWYSTDAGLQEKYELTLSSIATPLVDTATES